MSNLGAKSDPVFSQIDCGDDGVKVSIKLDVSDLATVDGVRIMHSVVQGQASVDPAFAESSAVFMAFKRLQQNHRIRIVDFSSLLVKRYLAYNIYGLVVEGMGHLEQMFNQWQTTIVSCEKLVADLEAKELEGRFFEKGNVYAMASGYLTSLVQKLQLKSSEARNEMAILEDDRRQYEKKIDLKAKKMITKVGCFSNYSHLL